MLTLAASYEPLSNLIGNSLSRMLVDDRYYGNLSGGALTARDALHDVLRNEPPMANYSAHYPRRDVYFHGVWLRAGQLVLVSYAAASTQSGRSAPGESTGAAGSGGGAHLAWAAGPHACPAQQQPALLIATTAIERLTAWLSDIELTVRYDELSWRPGPFHARAGLAAGAVQPRQPGPGGRPPLARRRRGPARTGPGPSRVRAAVCRPSARADRRRCPGRGAPHGPRAGAAVEGTCVQREFPPPWRLRSGLPGALRPTPSATVRCPSEFEGFVERPPLG